VTTPPGGFIPVGTPRYEALSTTYEVAFPADTFERFGLVAGNTAVLVQFGGTTVPANDNAAFDLEGRDHWVGMDIPVGATVWIRANSGTPSVTLIGYDPVPAPSGPKLFTAERSAAGEATIRWEPSDTGTRPTAIALRYRRRNAADSNWGNWQTVSGENYASGMDVISGLTQGARRYQFEGILSANAGSAPPAYAEVNV